MTRPDVVTMRSSWAMGRFGTVFGQHLCHPGTSSANA